jgi:hypothetical protein
MNYEYLYDQPELPGFTPEYIEIMKKHFISLFDASNRWRTISYFLASALLITASLIVGIADNLFGIAMLFGGIIFLFFSLLHPWKKWKNYAIMAGIFAGIIVLTMAVTIILGLTGNEKYINEAWVIIIVCFICIPGIIVGITGAILHRKRNRPDLD